MKKILAMMVGLLVAAVASAQTVQINGAGATFPYPIYSKWFSDYNPNVQINYQSIGSGGGIRQLTRRQCSSAHPMVR
jgi:phosphate transport system substrate-binding protein